MLTGDELLFFNAHPGLLPLYEALRGKILAAQPDASVRISKTQISFRSRYIFAMVSLPVHRRKGWPEEYLLFSFALGRRLDSPRVAQAVEPYPGRWTHHTRVDSPCALDAWLMSMLAEAHAFAQAKSCRNGAKKVGRDIDKGRTDLIK